MIPHSEQPVVVVFGAAVRRDGTPSGAMRDRVGAAAAFARRLAPEPIFIVTGGKGARGRSEAELMAELLVQRAVPAERIIVEPTARNTFRSALAVSWIVKRRFPGAPVYVATSAYHMPRCVLLLGVAGLDAHRSRPAIGPASSAVLQRWYWRAREVAAIPTDLLLMLWTRLRGAV